MKEFIPSLENQDTEEKTEAPPLPLAGKEIGGPSGLEPTRFGDWEKNGRCSDF